MAPEGGGLLYSHTASPRACQTNIPGVYFLVSCGKREFRGYLIVSQEVPEGLKPDRKLAAQFVRAILRFVPGSDDDPGKGERLRLRLIDIPIAPERLQQPIDFLTLLLHGQGRTRPESIILMVLEIAERGIGIAQVAFLGPGPEEIILA